MTTTLPGLAPRSRTEQLQPGRQAPALRQRPRPVWWLSPIGAVLLVIPVSLLVADRIPDLDYRTFYRAPKVLTHADTRLFLVAAAVLTLGLLVPMVARVARPMPAWPALPASSADALRRGEPVAFWLTVAGYLLLGVLGLARGATPSVLYSAIVSGDNYTGQLKTLFAPVAGITSLTQVGIAYVVVAGTLLTEGSSSRLLRRVAIVVLLGLARAYLLTERLAVLELLVPLLAIGAFHLRQRWRNGGWVGAVPIVAVPALLVVFGAFEYSRSWVFFRDRTTLSFPEFVVNRLAGYYATSYNNGALQLAHPVSGRLPYDSIQAFWTAPGISQLNLYELLSHQGGSDLLNTVLAQYGNPEFNNPGGLATPFIDFGHVGGFVFFFLCGLVVGTAYTGWRSGRPVGLLTYPVMFTGLLELPRYVYWTQGRVVPAAVVLLVLASVMNRAPQRSLVPVVTPPASPR